MFGVFKSKPEEKLKKEYSAKLEVAMRAQRDGDIRKYSELSEEADAILKRIEALELNNSGS